MVPAEAALVQVVMLVIQLPRGDLGGASLTISVRHGVLLQGMNSILPVHPMKVVHYPASGEGQPGEPWKGALKFFNVPGEADLINFGEVFVLD